MGPRRVRATAATEIHIERLESVFFGDDGGERGCKKRRRSGLRTSVALSTRRRIGHRDKPSATCFYFFFVFFFFTSRATPTLVPSRSPSPGESPT